MGITNLNFKSKMKVSTLTLILMLWMVSSYQTESVFPSRQLNQTCNSIEFVSNTGNGQHWDPDAATRICEGYDYSGGEAFIPDSNGNCTSFFVCMRGDILIGGLCKVYVHAHNHCATEAQSKPGYIYRPNDEGDGWLCQNPDGWVCNEGVPERVQVNEENDFPFRLPDMPRDGPSIPGLKPIRRTGEGAWNRSERECQDSDCRQHDQLRRGPGRRD